MNIALLLQLPTFVPHQDRHVTWAVVYHREMASYVARLERTGNLPETERQALLEEEAVSRTRMLMAVRSQLN